MASVLTGGRLDNKLSSTPLRTELPGDNIASKQYRQLRRLTYGKTGHQWNKPANNVSWDRMLQETILIVTQGR